MRKRPGVRLTRRSAARALDRTGPSGDPRVDGVLGAATARGAEPDRTREDDLVALFSAADLTPAGPAKRPSMIQIARKRLAAAKIAVAATLAVLLAGGGVAFAATSGNLPSVLGGDDRSDHSRTHTSPAPDRQETLGPKPSGGPTTLPSASDPSYEGLCRAFQKAATTNPGKAADNPAFSALAAAAGGKAKIAPYCASLIGAPGSRPTSGPTPGPTTGTTDPAPGGTSPTHPVHPAHPAHPSHPSKPTKAPKPTKPAHPTQAANPTKPPKTPHPSKPTKSPKS